MKLVFLAIMCCVTIAAADDQVTAAAKSHYDRGHALYEAKRYQEARAEFSAGFDLSKKPAFLFNAAECSRQLGDKDRARDEYTRYLELEPAGKLAPLAKQRLAELGPTAAPATPPKPEPTKPALPPVPAPAPKSEPPPPMIQTPPVAPAISSSGDGSGMRIAGFVVAGGGVALALTGAYFGHKAASLGDEVTKQCNLGCSPDYVKSQAAEGRHDERMQWWLYGAGAGAVVAGGVLYWLGAKQSNESPVAVIPHGDGAVVSWNGSW